MTRIGKVKVFTSEGKLIREGNARDGDFGVKKIFGMFSPSELVRSGVLTVGLVFGAGVLWDGINSHFKTMDNDLATFLITFKEFKQDSDSFHHLMFQKLDDKDRRINCVAESLSRCCPASQNC